MRRSAWYIALAIAALVVAVLVVGYVALRDVGVRTADILSNYREDVLYGGLTIQYPLDNTLFPPEIVSPAFRWDDGKSKANAWLLTIKFGDDPERMSFLTEQPAWTPEAADWETIKKRSLDKDARVTILGVNRRAPKRILSSAGISIRTSKDEVGAPIFYREVNLPFIDAVKDPTRIRWRFGLVSSAQQPPIVLEGLPVCGNCHSFSRNGRVLGMDVDYANSKGSYVIAPTAEEMLLATSEIITWDDYKREDREQTFGLLSQISPDGRTAISTVKDRSVFVPKPDLAFSQLFFPIKGILATYDRGTGAFAALPGADDRQYVQSNPSWSPDGENIVFARAKAYTLKHERSQGSVLLTAEECEEFLKEGKFFLFDLYRIPFNGGRGGAPTPIQGASNNGMSNFFARYSPDGKWIVFCKAKSYMLLQPDSELYIIPAEGGQARRLECNLSRMNSWHSWSPNGRWLVFSSKAYTPYTQLFLTHIDEQGRSSPPALLAQFTAPDRAANIPEFVNTSATAIRRIRERFLDDYSFERAGNEFYRYGDPDGAIPHYRKALALNPNNTRVHQRLGFLLYHVKEMPKEGMAHSREALRVDPNNGCAHYDVGLALLHEKKPDQAVKHLEAAVGLLPNGLDKQYNAPDFQGYLGLALFLSGEFEHATEHLFRAAKLDPKTPSRQFGAAVALAAQGRIDEMLGYYTRLVELEQGTAASAARDQAQAKEYVKTEAFREVALQACAENLSKVAGLYPDNARLHYGLAVVLAAQGEIAQTLASYTKAVALAPQVDRSPILHDFLAMNYARVGQFDNAVYSAGKAVALARATANESLAREIEKRIELYKSNQPYRPPAWRTRK
jgi:tetratricopeptide (TPR) repeat protein